MILHDETEEAFGYYPNDLKLQSNKPILAACDECGKVRNIRNSAYHPLCKSCVKKGENCSNVTRAKLSAALRGNTRALGFDHTEASKALMSAAKKGITFTEEHKRNICASKTRDKNPNWKGGISFEPYCVKFNEEFKEYIRAKFEYKCFLCSITQVENGQKLSVHHVNYNKDCGCDGDETCNFVPLCKRCHSKTNSNRDHWQQRITNKLHCMIIGWNI